MYKVCIIGNGCAGKTTLGKKLSHDLSLPFFEMDEKLKFLKTTPFPTRQQIRHFSRELNKLLDKDKWVVEESTGTILETVTRIELNQPEDIEGVLKHVQSNNRYLEKKFFEMDKRLVELEDRLHN